MNPLWDSLVVSLSENYVLDKCYYVKVLLHAEEVSFECSHLQSTPDNSNLQGELKKVRVIGSLKQITGSKEISKWMGRKGN